MAQIPASPISVVPKRQTAKLQSVQVLRGLAVLLVLLRHILVMESKYGRGEVLLGDFFKIGDAGVDLFFVISGFVMVTVTARIFQKKGAVASFLYKRAARIYPLYWLYSLVILAVFLKFPQMVNSGQGNRVDLLASFTLLPQPMMPLLLQGWTLTFELYFYLVFAFTLLAPLRLLPRFLGLWAVVVAIGWSLGEARVGLFQTAAAMVVFSPLTMEFIFGCGIALLIRGGWKRGGLGCAGSGCLLLAATTFLGDPHAVPSLRLIAFGLPAALIVYGAVTAEIAGGLRFPRFLEKVGDASYSIYLSHFLVISALGRIWQKIGVSGLWDNAAAIAVMTVCALMAGWASYRFLEQPMLSYFHTRQFRRAVIQPQ